MLLWPRYLAVQSVPLLIIILELFKVCYSVVYVSRLFYLLIIRVIKAPQLTGLEMSNQDKHWHRFYGLVIIITIIVFAGMSLKHQGYIEPLVINLRTSDHLDIFFFFGQIGIVWALLYAFLLTSKRM